RTDAGRPAPNRLRAVSNCHPGGALSGPIAATGGPLKQMPLANRGADLILRPESARACPSRFARSGNRSRAIAHGDLATPLTEHVSRGRSRNPAERAGA